MMTYNRSMKSLTAAMSPRLRPVGRVESRRVKLAPGGSRFFNAGLNTFARTRYGGARKQPLSVSQYYNAGVLTAYGQTDEARRELGDLFNDVMGAVVPGWDQRPEILKQIQVKPDPTRILQAAQRVAPQAGSQLVTAANRYGLSVWTNTPAGPVQVTPGMAQGLYQGAPWFTRAQEVVGGIPTWGWIAAAGGAALLFVLARR